MDFTFRFVFVATVLGGFCVPAGAEPLRPARCENPLPERLRVRLIMPASVAPLTGRAIIPMVERIWAAEGISFEWPPRAEGDATKDVDVFVLVQEAPIAGAPQNALGAVQFSGGQPSKVIRVSTRALRQWATSRMSAVMGEPRQPLLQNTMTSRERLEHALARVVAHEIGHVMLASPDHSRNGVMGRDFTSLFADGAEREARLDDAARERLRARRAGTALCEN